MGQDISILAPLYELVVSALNRRVHGLALPTFDRRDDWLWIAVRALICEGPTGAALKAFFATDVQAPAPTKRGPKGKKRGPKTQITDTVYHMVTVQHLSYRSIAKRIYGEDTMETTARVRALYSRAKRKHAGGAVPPKQLDS
jgi:hypothetical protein